MLSQAEMQTAMAEHCFSKGKCLMGTLIRPPSAIYNKKMIYQRQFFNKKIIFIING
jgi:hypothetical protein